MLVLVRAPRLAAKSLDPVGPHVIEPPRGHAPSGLPPPCLCERLVDRLGRPGGPERLLRLLYELEVQVQGCAPHVRHRMPPVGRSKAYRDDVSYMDGSSTYLMPEPARVAAKARSHSASGTTSVTSGLSTTRGSPISSSARRHERGVDALPLVTVSSR